MRCQLATAAAAVTVCLLMIAPVCWSVYTNILIYTVYVLLCVYVYIYIHVYSLRTILCVCVSTIAVYLPANDYTYAGLGVYAS